MPSESFKSVGLSGKPLKELEAPTARLTTALLQLWLDKKGDRDMPCRRDFSPVEMKELLPHIYMIDVLGGGADYRIRLWGTALTDLIGTDYTGALMSEADDEVGWRKKVYQLTYWRGAPVFYQYSLGEMGRPLLTTENVLLPVKDGDGNFSILLCLSQIIERRDPLLDHIPNLT